MSVFLVRDLRWSTHLNPTSLIERTFAASAGFCIFDRSTLLAAQFETDVYPIYSITKSFIACLVLMAVEEGRLKLDDTLAECLPDAGVPQAELITLKTLLNHTAGLPDYGHLPAYARALRFEPAPWSDETFASHTYRQGLLHTPGTKFTYSNPGYAILVRLLERIYNKNLSTLLQEKICRPLSLHATRILNSFADPDITTRSLNLGLARHLVQEYIS